MSSISSTNGRTFATSTKQKQVESLNGFSLSCEQKRLTSVVTAFSQLKAYSENKCHEILQSSGKTNDKLLPTRNNGFINAVYHAYNYHARLVLRPDDVWTCIETQFSLYMNKHAETLRPKFVKHEGQKELCVTIPGSLRTADYSVFARAMIEKIHASLVDDTVREWLMPDFTTTTLNDRTVASVIVMSAMQQYFTYKCCLQCGIPEVTLLGVLEDWQKLRAKVDKLLEYDVGGEMKQWHAWLAAVLDEFVASYRGEVNLDFWDRVCHWSGGGSGPSWLGGWLPVFSRFAANGNVIKSSSSPYTSPNIPWKGASFTQPMPVIDSADIAGGVVSVPVTVDDNGVQSKTRMFAGQIGYTLNDAFDTVQPRSDWMIALVNK